MSATTTGPDRPVARRRDLPLLVFVGVVVLVVVASFVGAKALTSGSRSPESRAAAAVQQYLEALTAGDAGKALSYAATPPADTSLLTDEVLRASQELAPLADITVVPGGTESRVDVTFTRGGEPGSDTYRVTRTDDGYKLDQVSGTVSFVTAGNDELPLLANGVEVTTSTVELFPGAYAFTTGLPNVDWGDDARATVRISLPSDVPRLAPRVTAAGKKAFVAGAKKIVSACTAKRQLNPSSSCPFGLRQPTSGPKVPDSTVRWRLEGNPWGAVDDPTISSFIDPGVAKASTSMTFVCTCRYSTGEACLPQRVTNRVTFAADLTTDPMKVAFSSF